RSASIFGGWQVIGLALVVGFLFGGASCDRCGMSLKSDFTSPLTAVYTASRAGVPHVTLRSIVYSDHPAESPAFEQLTFILALAGPARKVDPLPCVRVEEIATESIQLTLDGCMAGAELAPEFTGSPERMRSVLPPGSILGDIEQQPPGTGTSFVIRFTRAPAYRIQTLPAGSGVVQFVLQARSFKAPWITVDPATVRRVMGLQPSLLKIEYRPPSMTSDQTSVDLPLRVILNSGGEITQTFAIPFADFRARDEASIVTLAQSLLKGAEHAGAPRDLQDAEPHDPITAFAFETMKKQAATIEQRSGTAVRNEYMFGQLEEFARLKPAREQVPALRRMEQSYASVQTAGDERYLLRLFANFASAKLQALGERAQPQEIPGGQWTAGPKWTRTRSPLVSDSEPFFDEPPFWRPWRKTQVATVYGLSAHRCSLHARRKGEAFDSEALRRKYGNSLALEIAGTYTSPDRSIAALAAVNGVLAGFLPRAWEGLAIIRDGRVQIVSVLSLTPDMLGEASGPCLHIFTSPDHFLQFLHHIRKNEVSFVQGHLLTLQGRYDASLNDTVRARRRALVTNAGGAVEVIDFAGTREMTLRECGKWLSSFDAGGTAMNLDTGGWDFGRQYTADGGLHNLGMEALTDERLSNKFVFVK
ncbi:MAG TPA: hypothetical protein VEZ11_10900, partial [Thermoanaerobaculia bacterium]|nr:hypothetical protein [Thermoanaerobaculia bacterium]